MADRMTSVVVERIRVSKLNVAISVAKLGSTDGQSLQWYTKGHLTVFLVAVNKADDMHQEKRELMILMHWNYHHSLTLDEDGKR